ncbi:diguanylate cyclase (GGDEF) domain-containing protein [Quadrisphaera granulorum]|uniref:Diguanylate cyclase (GGDEF)-like protein n=1 Tax=Quadrisphaera granulorum TaxID=317664 RepID=A0A315ZQX5_9ACTN|nr:GGDEF domain-containing protein [Quadrisphaera granulorum]PWJ47981.1 diguanylate cyclase (GGDEF)-like protein [Quadrisphaera granulorum]SZE98553.1 diguanylate cyclase (GGDEF) domain-containing protein [Quadrisphaera granulorum]
MPSALGLLIAAAHAVLLAVQATGEVPLPWAAATAGPQIALTATCGVWWLCAGSYTIVRRGDVGREAAVIPLGHVVAMATMGVFSAIPGVPWCTAVALVTIPIATGIRWSASVVRVVLATAAVASVAVSFTAVGARAGIGLGIFAAACTMISVLTPTLVMLRLESRLRDAADTALRQAVTDPLTGLLNRRGLEEHAARGDAWGVAALGAPFDSRARDGGGHIGVAVVDVDHFKRVNDEFGHAAGDVVLRAVADVMRQHVRATDLLVRHGGEEFAWVGRWPDAEAAMASAERLRQAVSEAPMPHGRAVTVSIGVTVSTTSDPPAPDADPVAEVHRLIARADIALYTAKRTGRNCVVLASAAGTTDDSNDSNDSNDDASAVELNAGAGAP